MMKPVLFVQISLEFDINGIALFVSAEANFQYYQLYKNKVIKARLLMWLRDQNQILLVNLTITVLIILIQYIFRILSIFEIILELMNMFFYIV